MTSGEERNSWDVIDAPKKVRVVSRRALGVSSGSSISYESQPTQSFIVLSENSSVGSIVPVFPATPPFVFQTNTVGDKLREMRQALFVVRNRLPIEIREDTAANLNLLVDALQDDEERPELRIESLQRGLEFLAEARPVVAPTFSVVAGGDFYLQWFDNRSSVVGAIFRASDEAVWSATQVDDGASGRRMSEGGVRPTTKLGPILSAVAPWVFSGDTSSSRNRTAA